jgi:large subunit ribosomal protein L21e
MIKHKRVRERGKLGLSRLFREFKKGDKISLVCVPGQKSDFPLRFHGRTGNVLRKQGNAFVVNIKDGGQNKKFVVKRIHLKKLSS